MSATLSESARAHNNYSISVEPPYFYEGQEVRVRLTASDVWRGNPKAAFNITDLGSVAMRMYQYSSTHGTDCALYTASETALRERDQFGFRHWDHDKGAIVTPYAFFTFDVPKSETEFVFCFKHRWVALDYVNSPSALNGVWTLGIDSERGMQVFAGVASNMFFRLADPTTGQYGIIQLLSTDSWNFTYPPSNCPQQTNEANGVHAQCADGDNLKIVPLGAPCTFDLQSYGKYYFGTDYVHPNGVWRDTALEGVREGATAGGVGAFGTQYANPLVDSWSSWGIYYRAHSLDRNGPSASLIDIPSRGTVGDVVNHAYAYVRLPEEVASFEVCYSGKEWRTRLVEGNTTSYNAPLWRKLLRCTGGDVTNGVCSSARSSGFSFAVRAEVIGWTMVDLSPGTWGDIVFDDSGENQINPRRSLNSLSAQTAPTTLSYPIPATSTANYWNPTGGDYFKIVPSTVLTEHQLTGRSGAYGHPKFGSFPGTGCWDTTYNFPATETSLGGFVDLEHAYPIGSFDLSYDPSLPRNHILHDAPHGVNATFSHVYVPSDGSYAVCYRRTCSFGGATCEAHAGFRVLPFHKSTVGTVPSRWLHFEDSYTPGVVSGYSHLLTAGTYTSLVKYPGEVLWAMNDTRSDTHGPLMLDMNRTLSAFSLLDSRRWSFFAPGAMTKKVATELEGSALRVVMSSKSCVYPTFTGRKDEGFESLDAGLLECNHKEAESQAFATSTSWTCEGSSSNVTSANTMTFYIKVPNPGTYRICLRTRGWNWRELPGYMTPTASALDEISLFSMETRAGMEALFLISDVKEGLSTGPAQTCVDGAKVASLLDSSVMECPPYTSSDIFRLVPEHAECDINPSNWRPHLADTYLSMYCPVQGAGTYAQSGLWYDAVLATPPTSQCLTAAPVAAMCNGVCNRDSRALRDFTAAASEFVDDIVPYDSVSENIGMTAALLTLPKFIPTKTRANFYTICYKQTLKQNWVVFNTSFEVRPPLSLEVLSPALRKTLLLSGEMQEFVVKAPFLLKIDPQPMKKGWSLLTPMLASFTAKLIRYNASVANQHCGAPGAGTEGQDYSASTHTVFMDKPRTSLTDSSGNTLPPQSWSVLRFYLITPHDAGEYFMCIQLRRDVTEALSWWRAGNVSYDVADNGVRWFVRPGNQPINTGLTNVNLLRCLSATPGAHCDPAATLETFDISANQDSAKVVPWNMTCSTPGYDPRIFGGNSTHVGVESDPLGETNLGPADGISDVADISLSLPLPPGNLPTPYKVCVRTKFLGQYLKGQHTSTRRWVEVKQGNAISGQVLIYNEVGRLAFLAKAAVVTAWDIDEPLRPRKSLFSGVNHSSAIGLAGASTEYVRNPSTVSPSEATIIGAGFTFGTTAVVPDSDRVVHKFKLVQYSAPRQKAPPLGGDTTSWGDITQWEQRIGADCSGPAADSTTNIEPCTPNGDVPCPGLLPLTTGYSNRIHALFHLPILAGSYIVCYKAMLPGSTVDQPWHWVRGGESKDPRLYSHPSFLEYAVNLNQSNVTVYDMRIVTNKTSGGFSPVSSWCAPASQASGEGVPCIIQNSGGHRHDLIRVVNSSQVCPAPRTPYDATTTPTDGSGWLKLARLTNVSVIIEPPPSGVRPFSLPPLYPSPTGGYKLCVYKAGEATAKYYSTLYKEYVTRKGVAYQLQNRGLEKTKGGDSGFWVAVAPTKLVVRSNVVYDSTKRFMEYANGLEAAYGSVNEADVTDPQTGKYSLTPLLRSGTTVDYNVVVASDAGTVIPMGSYPIEVLRCRTTTSWTVGLRCDTNYIPEDPGDFTVENVNPSCRGEVAEQYGWPVNGLKQFMRNGHIKFSLQYTSACPQNHFGCGVKFSATREDGTYVDSAAQWVNVNSYTPDSVSIAGHETNPALFGTKLSPTGCGTSNSPDCFLLTCQHEVLCTITIRARYQGPTEFSPTGSVALVYSENDYFGSTVSKEGIPKPVTDVFANTVGKLVTSTSVWGRGGLYTHTFTPAIESGTEGYVYLNFSFGGFGTTGLWTRFVVKVTKALPQVFLLEYIRPLDVMKGLHHQEPVRQSAPPFYAGQQNGQLVATKGSYLEALVPYQLKYQPTKQSGEKVAEALGAMHGWQITALVEGSTVNRVVAIPGVSQEMYTSVPTTIEKQTLDYRPTVDDLFFTIPFRVFVADNGCSRFNEIGGCKVTFQFQHLGNPKYSVFSDLITPVRVPASTLEISLAQQTQTRGLYMSVREGIEVTVRPGTYVRSLQNTEVFVYDEFHYGAIFAMIEGPFPSDGVTNRDGVFILQDPSPTAQVTRGCVVHSTTTPPPIIPGVPGSNTNTTLTGFARYAQNGCAVWSYHPQMLHDVRGWGARWVMRPNKPCFQCSFTFHSAWGAGPQSHLKTSGTQRGTATLTWGQDDMTLRCSDARITFGEAGAVTDSFEVTVLAGVQDLPGVSAGYPRWWVYTDTARDLTHTETGYPKQQGKLYTLHRLAMDPHIWAAQNLTQLPTGEILTGKMGQNAEVTFRGLFLRGAVQPLAGLTELFNLQFHAVGAVYDVSAGAPIGSIPSSEKMYSCSSTLVVSRYFYQEPELRIQPLSVTAASPLCAQAVGCKEWSITTDVFFEKGISVTILFMNPTTQGGWVPDTSVKRNATVVPRGGPSSSPSNTAPQWTFDKVSQSYTSSGMVLDSVFNTAPLKNRGGQTYTFGAIDVIARRPSIANIFPPDGKRQISFVYGSNSGVFEKAPVRQAEFSICDSKWSDTAGFEATGATCITMKLWVLPSQYQPELAIWTEPGGGQKIFGKGEGCGPSPTLLNVELLPYYVPKYTLATSATTRYYIYDNKVEASLSLAGDKQFLVPAKGKMAMKALLATTSVTQTSNLSAALQHSLLLPDLIIPFSFYGRNAISSIGGGEKLVVASQMYEGFSNIVAMVNISTTARYFWVGAATTEVFSSLTLTAGGVAVDEECPSRRFLQSSLHNYMTYSPGPPGKGWDYAKAASAHAGVPFPIEVVVKTQANLRAWSFHDGTLVKTTKRSWEGCNDGGTFAVYSMIPALDTEEQSTRDGALSSFIGGSGVANSSIPSVAGAAVVWSVFAKRCESCTLQIDLCYVGRGDADCMQASDSTHPSDVHPLLPARTKITKPFSIEDPEPSTFQILQQSTPLGVVRPVPNMAPPGNAAPAPPREMTEIFVGESFSIKGANVLLYAKGQQTSWAMSDVLGSTWRRKVYARAQWVSTTPDGVDSAAHMVYGYGGFMHDASARAGKIMQGCDASLTFNEFGNAASYQARLTQTDSGAYTFFFTRPCSFCEVWVEYVLEKTIGDPDAAVPQKIQNFGMFRLRAYHRPNIANGLPKVGNVLFYRVKTCGVKWIAAGAPLPAVRRRKSFAVSVIRVDAHNSIANEANMTSSADVIPLIKGEGNGGGGLPTITSPLRGLDARGGAFMFRIQYSRACYLCNVTLQLASGASFVHTVLTDATQIVVVPAFSVREATTQWLTPTNAAGVWTFELYASDDAGDRAYSVAGPTLSAFQPLYSSYNVNGGSRVATTLSLGGQGSSKVIQAVLQDDVLTLASLQEGSPQVAVSSGSLVHNGIPVPALTGGAGTVGTVSVMISGSPGVAVALNFILEGLPPGAPVSYYGEKKVPSVGFSVVAKRFGLSDLSDLYTPNLCKKTGMAQGDPPCVFSAYLMGQVPTATLSDTEWYLSLSSPYSPASAQVSCFGCDAVVTSEAKYERGIAKFELALTSFYAAENEDCVCDVTVDTQITETGVLLNQTFSVTYSAAALTEWRWASSPSFGIKNVFQASTIASTAHSAPLRAVELQLEATNARGVHPSPEDVSTIQWGAPSVVVIEALMLPPGCFICTSRNRTDTTRCAIKLNPHGNRFTLAGHFVEGLSCVVPGKAVTGLSIYVGTSATASADLTVSLQDVAKVVLVEPKVNTSFWGLTAQTYPDPSLITTNGGHPAAVCGDGAVLRFDTTDLLGGLVSGENFMEYTLVGWRDKGGAVERWTFPNQDVSEKQISKSGTVTFALDTKMTTRVEIGGGKYVHAPWYFNVTASAPLVNNSEIVLIDFQAVDNIGPLYFVRRYHKLEVSTAHYGLSPYAPDADLRIGYNQSGSPPVQWLYDVVFLLLVKAVDRFGHVVHHVEDEGSELSIQFSAIGIPCLNIDAGVSSDGFSPWVFDTCIGKGGACQVHSTMANVKQCDASSSWSMGGGGGGGGGGVAGSTSEQRLSRGLLTIPSVKTSNISLAGGDLKRFTLTSRRVLQAPGQSAVVVAGTDRSFMYELEMQYLHAVIPIGDGIECNYVKSPIAYVIIILENIFDFRWVQPVGVKTLLRVLTSQKCTLVFTRKVEGFCISKLVVMNGGRLMKFSSLSGVLCRLRREACFQ